MYCVIVFLKVRRELHLLGVFERFVDENVSKIVYNNKNFDNA